MSPTASASRPDLSHHISKLARSRKPSPLKEIIDYMAKPSMISLSGGLPHPSLFPFKSISAEAFPSDTLLDAESPMWPEESLKLDVPITSTDGSICSMNELLQYSAQPGHRFILDFARRLTIEIHEPAYDDFAILLNSGSTDGWNKLTALLLEPGDYILTEEQIYPSAQAAFIPLGCKAAIVGVDAEGARPDLLEKLLREWDERKGRRPHVFYIVPVGQNPLGSTMGAQRRRDVYDICVKYDVMIIEDDPYSMLQFPPYGTREVGDTSDAETFVQTLVKSFLHYDVQGRVIRMETFSKTICPGARLGWFVANPMIVERLLRGTEVQTQHPSGFSQMIIGELLRQWGLSGFLQWTVNLKEQYRTRRDWMLDAINEQFTVIAADTSDVPNADGCLAYSKSDSKRLLFSFIPSVGGMFLWCTVYYRSHPSFLQLENSHKNPEGVFDKYLWDALEEANVLVTPGWYYRPWEGDDIVTVRDRGGITGRGYFRLAFSYESKANMLEGIRRLADVLHRDL